MTENANSSVRANLYKNCTKNSQEMRSRRHEVTVELRKSKKEDHLFKRRNIDDEEVMSPLKESNGQSPVLMTIDEIVLAMQSTDPDRHYAGTQAARKMLSREKNPPIDIMIEHGIVPICVRFLEAFEIPNLQFEAAWALTNIASGTPAQTHTVIEADAVPRFISLLDSPNITVSEQAVWALGNIAGDGPEARDIVLNNGAVEGLLRLINDETPLSFLRNIVWLMSNLCRNKEPSPPFEKIKPILPLLSHLLGHNDTQVLADACWALSYVTDDNNAKIQAVIDTGAVVRLVRLLDTKEPTIIVPALRSVGNIVTGTDIQTDTVIEAGGLSRLSRLLQSPRSNIVKEAAWTVSNITAGNQRQIQEVLDLGIFSHIRNVLVQGDFKSQKEAAWAVTNATTSGSPEQVLTLIDKYHILKPFCDLLDVKDARTIRVVLSGISNLFTLAERLGGVENLCVMIEELGGLDKLEALQSHENEEVYKKAFSIIDSYFGDNAGVDNNLAPKDIGEALEFDTKTSHAPKGGFEF